MARLILIFENPLLWDGKTEEELTGETNLSNISIHISESQKKTWRAFAQLCSGNAERNEIDDLLIEKIKPLRLTRQNDPAERLKIALEILHNSTVKRVRHSISGIGSIFSAHGASWSFPTAPAQTNSTTHEEDVAMKKRDLPRIMLFELAKFSLENGGISEPQKQLLLSFCQHHDIEEHYFGDFLKQAQIIHQETQKTINLILE